MIDPDTAVFVIWAGQLFLVIISAVILVGTVAVIGFFYTAIIGKRTKANEEKIAAIESILGGLGDTIKAVDEQNPDTHTHTHTHTLTI